jgi:uncharacterized protein (TIGR02246 family)
MVSKVPRRSGCVALTAVLIVSVAWAESRGSAADESAIRALIRSIGIDTKAGQFAADADWTNAFGRRLHGRDAISQWFDALAQSADYEAGADVPASRKVDVRFVRPDVAVVYEYIERVGQVDPTIRKAMPTRKIHIQFVLSKEGGKWLIQTELIMDEEHYQKEK